MTGRQADQELGAATAELAIAMPVLLLLVFGVIQLALWQHAVHVATAAAQEGARAARTEQGTAQAGRDHASEFLDQFGGGWISDPQITVTRTNERARVEVTGHTKAIILGIDLPIHALDESQVERFRPDLEAGP